MAFPLNPTKAGGTLKQRHVHKRLLLFLSTRLTGGLPEPLYISMANKCLWCWVPLVFRETIFVWFYKKHANNMGRFLFFAGAQSHWFQEEYYKAPILGGSTRNTLGRDMGLLCLAGCPLLLWFEEGTRQTPRRLPRCSSRGPQGAFGWGPMFSQPGSVFLFFFLFLFFFSPVLVVSS